MDQPHIPWPKLRSVVTGTGYLILAALVGICLIGLKPRQLVIRICQFWSAALAWIRAYCGI